MTSTTKQMNKHVLLMRWIVWALAVLFYFYEFLLRVAPSVMEKELMRDFAINAGQYGSLSAFYLYAYAPMQLPVGLLMDRFGARKLLTIATILCGLGTLLFGSTHILLFAQLGRFITGVGSAFAFVGLVYVCSHWFSGKMLALMVGLGNSLGMIGAVSGEGPVAFLVDMLGWRWTLIFLAILGFVLGAAMFFLVRNEPPAMQKHATKAESIVKVIHHFKDVLKNPYSWLVAFSGSFFYLSTVSFAGLWAVPFTQQLYNTSRASAGFAASMIYFGWIIGGPIIGYYSDKMKRRVPLILFTSFISLIMIAFAIYVPMPFWAYYIVMIVAGIFLAGELLSYSLAIDLNKFEAKGSAVAFTNFIVFIGASISQPLVGYILDSLWEGRIAQGVPLYSIENFKIALLTFPISLILCLLVTLLIREKKYHHHKTNEEMSP